MDKLNYWLNYIMDEASVSSAPPEWQQPGGGPQVTQNQAEYHPVTNHKPVTAPLAKPEPVENTDKPAIVVYKDSAMPERGTGGDFNLPKLNYQRIRFAEDDDDPGIMSEVETSATVGAYGRRTTRNRAYHTAQPFGTNANNATNVGAYITSASTLNLPRGPEKSVGLVFLNYQGETKRALLSDDIKSLEDIRNMFFKAFPMIFNMDYLHSNHVKIYVQDPARQDVFYELEDLRDVKDRTVLKLHEQLRPISPVPITSSSSSKPLSGPVTVYDIPISHTVIPAPAPPAPTPTPTQQYPRDQDDMNYFSEPEMDGPYRGSSQKPSGGGYGPGGPFQRRYGTLNAYYRSSDRVKYNGNGPPAKPQRFPGTLTPTRGLTSATPVRPVGSPVIRPAAYGSSGESEVESYTSRNYIGANESGLPYTVHDRSSNISRSGSVTPVIDEEARARMLNMEKQLANLSSLVHSALMTKGVSETVYKDIEMLRREILGPNRDDASDSGSVSRFSDVSSDKGSFTLNERDCQTNKTTMQQQHSPPERDIYTTGFVNQEYQSSHVSPEMRQLLKNAKKRTNELQVELKYLRRMAQVNAQSARDVLKDAFDRIRVILNTNKHLHIFAAQAQQQNLVENNPLLSDRSWVNQEQERYRNLMRNVEHDLNSFEKQIEELRQKVINGERKLRLSEIEQFTELLTNISKTAANLKTQFPNMQERLKSVMSYEMEKVVREEKFLKDEPYRLDNALKKCKKLTNTMVTMKKLALVQDPNAYQSERDRSQTSTPMSDRSGSNGNSNVPSKLNKTNYSVSTLPTSSPSMDNYHNRNPPTEFSAKKQYPANGTESGHEKPTHASTKVLDTLLEELQNVAKSGNAPEKPNGEKRVGFNDQVKHIVISDKGAGDSDTIKRSPKNLVTASNNITNIAYEKNSTVTTSVNGGAYDENMNIAPAKHVELPVYSKTFSSRSFPVYSENVANRMRMMSPQFNISSSNQNRDRDRSHSSTPLSVASEPASFDRFQPVPPPPPRSSSRTLVNGSSYTQSSRTFKSSDIAELKHQLNHVNGTVMHNPVRSTLAPPAIVQTNAMDDEGRGIKSASSSESVNSQEALSMSSSQQSKPPPPPPPPRNKQEMLEQRQHELMTKQRLFQTQYTKLQDTKRQSNGNVPNASSQYI